MKKILEFIGETVVIVLMVYLSIMIIITIFSLVSSFMLWEVPDFNSLEWLFTNKDGLFLNRVVIMIFLFIGIMIASED